MKKNAEVSQNCPICNSQVSKKGVIRIDYEPFTKYSCLRCGDYLIGSTAISHLQGDAQKIAVIGQWIRTKYDKASRNESGITEPIILTRKLIDDILKNIPSTPAE